MSFSTSLACRRRLKSSFKARIDDNYGTKNEGRTQQKRGGVFHGPHGGEVKKEESSHKRKHGRRSSAKKKPTGTGCGGERKDSTDGEISCCCSGGTESSKGRDLRRRDSKVNGADIYVARVTKKGLGSAKPCWRCLHWCYWAGVKRVFHWDESLGRWEVVKVNCPGADQYETTADIRLFAGTVSPCSWVGGRFFLLF